MSENIKEKKEKRALAKGAKCGLFILFSLLYFVFSAVSFTAVVYSTILWSLPVVAVILLIEFVLIIKTDVSPIALSFSGFVGMVITLIIAIALAEDNLFEFHYWTFFVAAARLFLGVISTLKRRKIKLTLIILILVAAIGYSGFYGIYAWPYRSYVIERQGGESDRTSSYNSINQLIIDEKDWEKFVAETPFNIQQTGGIIADYTWLENPLAYGKGTYPHIDGSTVCVPLAIEFARQHLGFNGEQAKSFVDFSTTHHAYEQLISGESDNFREIVEFEDVAYCVDMGKTDLFLGTEPSDAELSMANENGAELSKEPICYDAFVFITHKDNPVESLTVQQIKDIYSGKITNWKDVGGKDEKIRAFQREANSGSQTAMENLVMGGADLIDPIEVKVVEGMGMLVDAVAEYKNETASIGYTYRYYIDNLYKNDKIKTISVEGIEPTDDNIRNGEYPFTTNYYAVVNKNSDSAIAEQFREWILSEEGQKCVKQAGYITMN